MPGASFHSHYWAGDQAPAGPDPPLGSSAGGGYVPWMTTITAISLLLMALAAW